MATGSIIGLIVLVAIIVGLLLFYRFKIPKTSDKNAATEFIEGFVDKFKEIITNIVDTIDITSYSSVDTFIDDVYELAYDGCWEYVEEQLQKATENSVIGSLVAKCVTRENVESIIEGLISGSLLSSIEQKYVDRWNETTEQVIAEDVKLQEMADLYEAELAEVEPIEETEEEEIDTSELNPQTDEEGEYDPEDISQEIVGDITESDIVADESVQDLLNTLVDIENQSEE